MSRSKDHPHVQTVIAALDRAARYDRDHEQRHGHSAGAVLTSAGIIVSMGTCCERFSYPSGGGTIRWSPESARAVCIAFALHCPDEEIEELAAVAQCELESFDNGFYDDEGSDAR